MLNLTDQTWWTRREAAAYARVSEATIGREVRNGRLRHVRVGGRRSLRFKRKWVDEWLAAGLIISTPSGNAPGETADVTNADSRSREWLG